MEFKLGLTVEEREIVENHFKMGSLLVIVCTSTLSSGINFPARRVIIRTPMFNGKTIDVMSYKQMVGRAGRKGIDTCGESILMCSNPNEKKAAETLLNSKMPEVTSESMASNGDELMASIKRALLEVLVSATATKKTEIVQYIECFLSNKTHGAKNSDSCEKYIKWLHSNQFIDIVKIKDSESLVECYKPTQLGYAVVGSAMVWSFGLALI